MTDKQHKNNWILVVCCLLLVVLAFFIYTRFLSYSIYEDSTANLEEVYGHVGKDYAEFVDKNFRMLKDWGEGLALEDEKDSEVLQGILAPAKEYWEYHDFYFIKEDGSYLSDKGSEGSLELEKQDIARLWEGEGLEASMTLPDSGKQMLFIMPVEENTWQGFSYTAIAAGYDWDAVRKKLDISSYEEDPGCLLAYPDGTVLMTDSTAENIPDNINSYLAGVQFTHSGYESVKADLELKKAGHAQIRVDGQDYYLVYQPIRGCDYIMYCMIHTDKVNSRIGQLQAAAFMVFMGVLVISFLLGIELLLKKSWRDLSEMDTELQYKEQLFSILATNTDDVFIMCSIQDCKVEYVSPNIDRVLGISQEEVKEDIGALGYIDTVCGRRIEKDDLQHMVTGRPEVLEGEKIHRRTGEPHWYLETFYRVNIRDMEKYILVLSDRTKEKRNKEMLEQALKIAEEANQAKSTFLSNMSHDIRTPMNAIVGFSMLAENNLDNEEKVRDYIGKIKASSNHLLGLINDVLDMSKIESGKATLNLSEFDFMEVIEELNAVVIPLAKAKNQQFDIDASAVTHRRLLGDKLRINQILINLLSNAAKYTEEGGRISLSVREKEYKGKKHYRTFIFIVQDNGIGISEEYLASIFQPFTREENSTTNQVLGTGLGMAITKSLVELMGGEITVESKPGEGSTFTVEIILRIVKELKNRENIKAENAKELSENREQEKLTGVLAGKRFLVVEDNELNREVLTELLSLHHAESLTAENGKEAVEQFEKSGPGEIDMILMDVQMPVMNGYEATRAIRDSAHPSAKTIPIAAMTANAFSDDVRDALKAGMNGHIAKPIDLKQLEKVISDSFAQ